MLIISGETSFILLSCCWTCHWNREVTGALALILGGAVGAEGRGPDRVSLAGGGVRLRCPGRLRLTGGRLGVPGVMLGWAEGVRWRCPGRLRLVSGGVRWR